MFTLRDGPNIRICVEIKGRRAHKRKNWVDSGLLSSDLVYLIIGCRVEFLELTFRSEGQSK